jgi:hypothetical protein
MSTSENTRIYLLYYDEDISAYKEDPRIVPLRLSLQTIFLESIAFKMIDPATIPSDIEYIGFITPSFFKKTGLTLSDIQHNGDPSLIVAINSWCGNINYIEQGALCHQYFIQLFTWLMEQLHVHPIVNIYPKPHINSNMWLTTRNHAIEYMNFASHCMDIIVSAPPEIRALFSADCKYGKPLPPHFKYIFGVNYWPYYPFIIERCISLYADLKNIKVEPISR